MMRKFILLASVIGMSFGGAFAKEGTHLDNQFIIYKWYEGGIAHYGKAPARGVKNYTMLNEYGMEIVKERPYANSAGTNVIRPVRSEEPANLPVGAAESGTAETVEGMITKEQRCDTARKNARLLRNEKTVYEEDESGNLVPLSEGVVKERLTQAESQVRELCQ